MYLPNKQWKILYTLRSFLNVYWTQKTKSLSIIFWDDIWNGHSSEQNLRWNKNGKLRQLRRFNIGAKMNCRLFYEDIFSVHMSSIQGVPKNKYTHSCWRWTDIQCMQASMWEEIKGSGHPGSRHPKPWMSKTLDVQKPWTSKNLDVQNPGCPDPGCPETLDVRSPIFPLTWMLAYTVCQFISNSYVCTYFFGHPVSNSWAH